MNHIRQGQNNNSKRSRGRGRKPQSSGNRAYDSNGPDVKIRGTATHICEKYQQLARDAITSGDRVMAENYYQHAEHYYRLIMANQSPNEGQSRQQTALGYRPDDDQEYDDDDAVNEGPQGQMANQQQPNGNGNDDRRNGNGRHRPDRNPQNQASGNGGASQGYADVSDLPIEEQPQPDVMVAEGEGEAAEAASEQQPRRRPVRRRRPRGDGSEGSRNGASTGEATTA